MVCSACQGPLTASERFCGRCGAAVARSGAFVPPVPRPAPPAAASGFGTVATPAPTAVAAPAAVSTLSAPRLAPQEVVKGEFTVNRTDRSMGWLEGRITVTDARVIYQAEAKNVLNRSRITREIALGDVNGMSVSAGTGISPAAAAGIGMFSLFTLLLLAIAPSTVMRLIWLVVWAVVIGVMIALGRSTKVVFVLFARESDRSPLVITSGLRGSNPVTDFLRAMVSPLVSLLEALGVMHASTAITASDVDAVNAMYAEIGALIVDLQTRGVLADGVS